MGRKALRERTLRDLRAVFKAVDLVFFGGQCAEDGVTIVWRSFKSKPGEFLFGQYDPELKRVEINRRMAEPDWPGYVLMSVVHHELAHHVVALDHGTEFKHAEALNPWYWKSERWCDEFTQRLSDPEP